MESDDPRKRVGLGNVASGFCFSDQTRSPVDVLELSVNYNSMAPEDV